jgi:hypothetical protein
MDSSFFCSFLLRYCLLRECFLQDTGSSLTDQSVRPACSLAVRRLASVLPEMPASPQ